MTDPMIPKVLPLETFRKPICDESRPWNDVVEFVREHLGFYAKLGQVASTINQHW